MRLPVVVWSGEGTGMAEKKAPIAPRRADDASTMSLPSLPSNYASDSSARSPPLDGTLFELEPDLLDIRSK